MTIIQAVILGIVQGVTEFLPISSSGHLVLVPQLFSWDISPKEAFAFDVLLQAATLIAVITFFFHDLSNISKASISAIKTKTFLNPGTKLGLFLILSTIPAAVVGLLFNGYFENLFNNPFLTSVFLLINSLLLIIAEQAGNRSRVFLNIDWVDTIWVGIFQIFALFPGISRSGVTITGGMLRNLDRQSSARFSFLISIPLMIAAGINGFHKLFELPNTIEILPVFIIGSIISALVGFLSIKWLLRFLANRSLRYFSIYCFLFAIFNLVITYLKN